MSQLTLDRTHRRYEAFMAYRRLTAPILVGTAAAAVAAGGALAALLQLGWLTPSATVWGLLLVSGGSALLLWLLFLFATTYVDQATRVGAPADLTARASFEVLGCLKAAGAHQSSGTPLAAAAGGLLSAAASQQFLRRLQIDGDSFLEHLQTAVGALNVDTIWASAEKLVAESNDEVIEVEHLLGALLLDPACATWLRSRDLQDEDVRFVVWWMRSRRQTGTRQRQWWGSEKLLSAEGLGLNFAAGFTPLVDRFSRIPVGNLWDLVNEGHEKLVEQLILTLARARQSNVLLVGQPGVGRLGIIQELGRRVRIQQAHPALRGQRVLYLHIGELLARGTSSASQLATISQALSEIERAGNVIAVIDGLSSILAEEGEHKIDMTEILLPFFSSLTVRVVVIISSDEYHLHLKTNEELIHFFEVIQVPSASEEATLRSLAQAVSLIEKKHHVSIAYPALEALVRRTSGILQHIPYPERAFDVLEEAIVLAQTSAARQVTVEIVETLVTNKVGIPVGRLAAGEKQHLLELEDRMHQRLVNQNQAIAALARAMVRARAGVRTATRPIGTFLFMGPTGVGKTEAAKTLADTYFGSEKYLTRLDMSEFQTPQSVGSLIGTATHPVGRLTSLITDTPFTVLLLDEFEKAHASVKQLFLQVLDEGRLTDARGHTVSFQHAIIIATSNAGAPLIREEAKDGQLPAGFSERLQEHLITTGIFSPELLNRFDGVITFTPLTAEHLRTIAQGMLLKLNSRLDAEHGITVAVTPELIDFLVSIGYSPEFGARPLRRALQDTVEYAVAQRIIAGQTHPGQVLKLPVSLWVSERQS